MNETITVLERLYQLGPGIIAGVILVLGAMKKWCWYYQLTECETRCNAAVAQAEKREELWREIALTAIHTGKDMAEARKERRS